MLPLKKSKPQMNPLAYTTLMHGPPKIGKSEFWSHTDALYLDAGNNLKHLEVYKKRVDDWPAVKAALKDVWKLIQKGKCPYSGIIWDETGMMYDMAFTYTCEKHGFEHPADEAYGKGWEKIKFEFQRVVNFSCRMPIGTVFLAHSIEKDIEERTGKVTRIQADLKGGCRNVILPQVDTILYAGFSPSDGETRLLYTTGTEKIEAGSRGKKLFRLPRRLPFGYQDYMDAIKKSAQPKAPKAATKGGK